jgi:hypothetical protein
MKKVIAKLGEPCTVTSTTEGAFDPATGTVGAGTTTVQTGYAAPDQYNSFEMGSATTDDGYTVQQGDVKLVLSKLDARPKVGDTVTMDSVVYRIMDVYPVRMSGADVVYIVQGRV